MVDTSGVGTLNVPPTAMLFNSNEFLLFFGLFLLGYFFVHSSVFSRNLLVVVASYVFYSWWDPRFTFLLLGTSLLDFTVGRLMDRTTLPGRRRALLIASIVMNLGVLAVFKYFNFFRESFETLLHPMGGGTSSAIWNIVLPVGISFYTFQSMGYVIDVYRRHIPACENVVSFLAYVSFFPQLVAGPIERGANLLPQFYRKFSVRDVDAELGLWLVIWGMFKKVVLADNLAPMVELAYRSATPTGPVVVLGTVAFALQIYCDFSGYTDIASGLAKLLGFNLGLNFNLPYFATSLRDFWRRWHISLSTWLRDYLYVSLGGNRKGEARTYLNLGITMLLGGLWHGASMTFVLWGLWHGLGLMANRGVDQRWKERRLPVWAGWVLTQLFVLYGWMLFRASSMDQVLQFTAALSHWALPEWWRPFTMNLVVLATPLLAMQLWQWWTGNLRIALDLSVWKRAALQGSLVLLVIAFWQPEASPFIYFQF